MAGKNGKIKPTEKKKPLVMRIIVLAVAAAMVVGIIVGAVMGMN